MNNTIEKLNHTIDAKILYLYPRIIPIFYCIMILVSIIFPLPLFSLLQFPLPFESIPIPSPFYIYEPTIQILVSMYWIVFLMGVMLSIIYILEKTKNKIIEIYRQFFKSIIFKIIGGLSIFTIFIFLILLNDDIFQTMFLIMSYISDMIISLNLHTFYHVIMMIWIYFFGIIFVLNYATIGFIFIHSIKWIAKWIITHAI